MKIGVGDLPLVCTCFGKLGSLVAHFFGVLVVLVECGVVHVSLSLVNPRVLISFVVTEHGLARLFRVEWNKRWGQVPPVNLEKNYTS
jgi:hypothetical protein